MSRPSLKRCLVCGRTADQHDRVDLRACKRAVDEARVGRPAYRRRLGVETKTVEQWLVAEREAEARGYALGRESLRMLILQWAIKADTFPMQGRDDRPRFRCLECLAKWTGARDAHPPSDGCAVEVALRPAETPTVTEFVEVRS